MESTSHHKRRILNVKFPANIVVPLLLRWRPPLYRWDLRMLSWKITFFSSLFSISIYFFRALFAVLLSVRTGDTNILTVRIMSYDQIFDLFEFFIKDIFILYDSSFVPIWIMMFLGFFLDLELSETLDLLFLRQEKLALLYSCYLRVSLSSNRLSLNLLLWTWYLFSILLTVWVVQFWMGLAVMHCS